jgi:hypothetical protein
MPLRSALALALLVFLSTLPAGANQPVAPAAPTGGPAPQRVQLRWKVTEERPLAYEFVTREVSTGKRTLRVDLSELKQSKLTAKQRQELFEVHLPTQSALAAVLTAKPSGDVAAKVLVTRVTLAKPKRPTKADKQFASAAERTVGKVQIRATMTDWGFVTTDLDREQRNLVALMFELPSKPVAVGETWTHSADLVKMGAGWEGESETLNRVELVELNQEAEGRTVAIIDFTLAERQEGKLADRRMKKQVPAAMEMTFVGRGEFLVEEGRWRRMAGRMTSRSKGPVQANSEQQFTLTPLDPIPPKVLAAE